MKTSRIGEQIFLKFDIVEFNEFTKLFKFSLRSDNINEGVTSWSSHFCAYISSIRMFQTLFYWDSWNIRFTAAVYFSYVLPLLGKLNKVTYVYIDAAVGMY